MKYFLSMNLLFIMVSCALRPDLDVVQKLERVSLDQKEYRGPDFFIKPDVQSMLQGRSPASIPNKKNTYSNLSNRQVYFLTLYNQYQLMKKVSGLNSHNKSCPAFHDLLLKNQDAVRTNEVSVLSKDYKVVHTDPTQVVYYPAMALPYSNSSDLYTALNQNDWENVEDYLKHALVNYTQNISTEVAQLCDKGVSKGYYLYENVVTYFKNDRSFHKTKKGIQAMLKIPVFANLVLLDHLKSEVAHQELGQNLLGRGELLWFNSYREAVNFGRKQNFVQR